MVSYNKFSYKQKWALSIIAFGLMIIAFGLFGNIIIDNIGIKDPPNLSTLIVEVGIGIVIAYVIYSISNDQQKEMKDLVTTINTQQDEIKKLVNDIKSIEEKQQKLIEDAEIFRKRKFDYVTNSISLSFTNFINMLKQNLYFISQIKNDDSLEDEIIVGDLLDNVYMIRDELRDLEQILDAQAGTIDPDIEKNVKDISDELKQWIRNKDPYEYLESSEIKTKKIVKMMAEILEKLPTPSV
ncbi:hypothetical protein [Nitrosopumilus adriaticus]|uniref:hypothetical protein n=1 Tax=Nitrosopumilus adriaticus TaxID=1580092 RepID=UPI00352E1D77